MIIKEKAKAKVDLSKREIHGHVCIDLHNHNSGFTERVEADNLVTNALEMVMPAVARANRWSEIFPIASRGLGGLYLFDGALTENANNVEFPGNVHMTGFAGQTANGTEKYSGSFNAVESEEVAGGYKSVWDFSTAQANGTIASLSRTNYCVGAYGPLLQSADLFTNTHFGSMVKNVFNSIWLFKDGISYGGSGSTRYSGRIVCDNLNVNDPFPTYNDEIVAETNQEIDNGLIRDGNDGYGYVGISGTTNSFTYKKIKYSDLSFDVSEAITITVAGASFQSFSALRWAFCDGYVYLEKSDSRGIYKVNLANTADVTLIEFPEGYILERSSTNNHLKALVRTKTGVIMARFQTESSPTTYSTALIYPDGAIRHFLTLDTVLYCADYCTMLGDLLYSFPYQSGSFYNTYFGSLKNYLGTIANISPVVKTASQSMKVTYTLTNV